MAKIFGFEEITKKLSALGAAAGGQALRASAMTAMLPAQRAARAAAPIADPPYHEGSGIKRLANGTTIYGSGAIRTVNPYPKKTYKGRLVTPGFASRHIGRKSVLSDDRTQVTVMLGVESEAFYAVQFIELGTSHFAKRPWLEPAFRGSLPEVEAALKEALLKRLDLAATKGEAPIDAWLSDEAAGALDQ